MPSSPNRPNILFITSDQQRADCYGFAGRKVRTPHLDQLARDGTHFSACITPNLVCQPSRASILTGMLPLTHGVVDNGVDLPAATGALGFAGALAAAGYDTAFLGKAHFSTANTFAATGTAECRNSSGSFPPSWHGPYMGFDHAELMALGPVPPHAAHPAPSGTPLRALAVLTPRRNGGLRPVEVRDPAGQRCGADLEVRAAGGWEMKMVLPVKPPGAR